MSSIKIEIRTGDSVLEVTDSNVEDRMYASDADQGLEALIDKTVDRVKKALDIEPGALDTEKLGRAVSLFWRYSSGGEMTDRELGQAIIDKMVDLPWPPRPIKDSPQA